MYGKNSHLSNLSHVKIGKLIKTVCQCCALLSTLESLYNIP